MGMTFLEGSFYLFVCFLLLIFTFAFPDETDTVIREGMGVMTGKEYFRLFFLLIFMVCVVLDDELTFEEMKQEIEEAIRNANANDETLNEEIVGNNNNRNNNNININEEYTTENLQFYVVENNNESKTEEEID